MTISIDAKTVTAVDVLAMYGRASDGLLNCSRELTDLSIQAQRLVAANNTVLTALRSYLRDDDDDDCDLCAGVGEISAQTERMRSLPLEIIGCPRCIEIAHSKRARDAIAEVGGPT